MAAQPAPTEITPSKAGSGRRSERTRCCLAPRCLAGGDAQHPVHCARGRLPGGVAVSFSLLSGAIDSRTARAILLVSGLIELLLPGASALRAVRVRTA